MSAPTVSVVIPVHGAALRFLADAVTSALAQDPAPDEVIVVDAGEPGPGPALGRFGDRVLQMTVPGAHAGARMNAGIARSRGELLAFLDADDLWLAGKLAAQLPAFEDPAVDVVLGAVQMFADPGMDPAEARTVVVPDDPQTGASKSTMVIRRSAFDRVGPFDDSVAPADFIDWWLRARETGVTEHHVDRVVARRRIHGTNTGLTHGDQLRAETMRALKLALDRRRAHG